MKNDACLNVVVLPCEAENKLPLYVACKIGENINFNYEILESFSTKDFDPLLYDLMVITAAVEFCDRYKRRYLSAWGRTFNIRLPVNTYDIWSSPHITRSLKKCLELLSGDTWNFEFYKGENGYSDVKQVSLPLNSQASRIMAFSNGLDSRCVAKLQEAHLGPDSLIKIRIGDSGKDIPKKRAFAAIPFDVKVDKGACEHSFRTRGFKFAVIAAIAAYLSNTSLVVVPESGQGVLSPVLLPLKGQYQDYRNHPFFFHHAESFISALLDVNINFIQPRLWLTKGETISEAKKVGLSEQEIISTRSCWRDRNFVKFDGRMHQCGVCAACILRRMSLFSAGIEDPGESYTVKDLNTEDISNSMPSFFPESAINTMKSDAATAIIHFDDLANLRSNKSKAYFDSHSLEIANFCGLDQSSVADNLEHLISKHREEWLNFTGHLKNKSFIRSWIQS